MAMHKLVIDRSKWACGVLFGQSMLYNTYTERMCCLGHYLVSLGLDKEELENKLNPYELITDKEKFDKLKDKMKNLIQENKKYDKRTFSSNSVARNVKWANQAMIINDDYTVPQEEREESLINEFAKIDVELSFTGKLK